MNVSSDPFIVFTLHRHHLPGFQKQKYFGGLFISQCLRNGNTNLNMIISLTSFVVFEVRKETDSVVKKIGKRFVLFIIQ